MAISYTSPSTIIPNVVRALLAADAEIAAYFERIAVSDLYQLDGPIMTPSLYVVPGTLSHDRQVGGETESTYTLSVVGVFTYPTPFLYGLAATAAPSLTQSAGTGQHTGAMTYYVTQFDARGESIASPSAAITVTAKDVTVARPTLASGALGWRIWRTKAGGKSPRHAATLRASESSWLDTLPDAALSDELAPIPFYAESVLDYVASVLYANETLTYSGTSYASPALLCQQGRDEIASARNLRVRELVVTVPTYIDPAANTVISGSV